MNATQLVSIALEVYRRNGPSSEFQHVVDACAAAANAGEMFCVLTGNANLRRVVACRHELLAAGYEVATTSDRAKISWAHALWS